MIALLTITDNRGFMVMLAALAIFLLLISFRRAR